jgi:hypothetical protein
MSIPHEASFVGGNDFWKKDFEMIGYEFGEDIIGGITEQDGVEKREGRRVGFFRNKS